MTYEELQNLDLLHDTLTLEKIVETLQAENANLRDELERTKRCLFQMQNAAIELAK